MGPLMDSGNSLYKAGHSLRRIGTGNMQPFLPLSRVFIQRGEGPEILKLSMVIIVLSQVLNNNLVPD